MSQSDPFGMFGGFPPGSTAPEPAKPAVEKGLPWNAKEFNGKLYLPIEQVCELLEQNNVLPQVRAGLERHIKRGS